jgi:thioredoxin
MWKIIWFLLFQNASSFQLHPPFGRRQNVSPRTLITTLFSTASTDINGMKLREIQQELKDRGASFQDCFDRESLTKRLREVRELGVDVQEQQPTSNEEKNPSETIATEPSSKTSTETAVKVEKETPAQTQTIPLEMLEELRSKRVRDLKEECARRQIRWGTFIEKEDMVQAIWKDMQEGLTFSVSGAMRPGKVADLTGEQLDLELTSSETPILLDIYATWCGPCKMMAPELEMVAAELGNKVRCAKLDSDKYAEWSSKYKIGALPTVMIFQNGQEQQRVEGALMKDDILKFFKQHVE